MSNITTNNQSQPLLYTMKEVATILHVNVGKANQLRRAGLIRCLKLGAWQVRREELIRFLKDSEGKDLTDPFNVKDIG